MAELADIQRTVQLNDPINELPGRRDLGSSSSPDLPTWSLAGSSKYRIFKKNLKIILFSYETFEVCRKYVLSQTVKNV